MGYFTDDFVSFFVKASKVTRKQPLISRGYSTRVYAVRSLIHQFLEAGGKQIISFGAGYDTNYFMLKVTHIHAILTCKQKGASFLNYFELDFPAVVHKKIYTIQKNPKLQALIPDWKVEGINN